MNPYYKKHIAEFEDRYVTALILGSGDIIASDLARYITKGNVAYIDTTKDVPKVPDDVSFIDDLIKKVGSPSIIIDDMHDNDSRSIEAFRILFPRLMPGGVYIVESAAVSLQYESDPWSDNWILLNMLKSLVVSCNRKYVSNPKGSLVPIESIHFYSNLCFIHKS